MNKNIYLILFLLLFLCGCTSSNFIEVSTISQSDAAFKDNKTLTVLLNVSVFDAERKDTVLSWNVDSTNITYSGYYLGEIDILTGNKKIINKHLIKSDDIVISGKIVAIKSGSPVKIILLKNSTNYEDYKELSITDLDVIYDAYNDNKILYLTSDNNLMDYDFLANSINSVLSFAPTVVLYNPMTGTQIAYVNNTTHTLSTINTDGSNNINILTGYTINKICWDPEGAFIVFTTDTEIYRVNTDGTNLLKLADYTKPTEYRESCLSINKLVFILKNAIETTSF